MMKIRITKYIFIILLICILFIYFFKGCNTNNINTNTKIIDSLKTELSIIQIKNDSIETSYLKSIDSLKQTYNNKYYKLKTEYIYNINKITQLPIDSQIIYFNAEIENTDSIYPKKCINKTDTIIQITKPHITSINLKFEELKYNKQLNDTLSSQIDSMYILFDQSKTILNLKNNEISILTNIVKEQDIDINNSYKNIKLINKQYNKNIIKYTIASGIIGIIVGIIIMK